MRTQRSRRTLLRQAGFLGAALATVSASPAEADVTPSASAVPAAPAPAPGRGPVGSWSVLVTIDGATDVERAHFSFNADGQVVMQTIRDSHTGIGSWEPVNGGFVYAMRSLRADATGQFVAELRVNHTAQFNPDGTYTSTGTGQAVDVNGNVLMEVQSKAVGTRFGVNG